ncbi:MAG: hypothetical protein KDH15_22220 [Rhodocyclaceae bacterium]|nr:hypothetical protein [Rhodocyclaceae bacterium]
MIDRNLLARLDAMAARDRETRSRLLEQGALYGDYAVAMERVHRENAEALAALVAAHGWPGRSLVGVEGCRAAWLVAQHAICTPDLQRRFRACLRQAADAGEVPERQWAMLDDRIRFNEGRAQRYGTVLDWNEDGELACTLEDPAAVDLRRRSVGLPPFAEALAAHRAEVAAEGGGPPEDLADYRRRAELWARRTGWR